MLKIILTKYRAPVSLKIIRRAECSQNVKKKYKRSSVRKFEHCLYMFILENLKHAANLESVIRPRTEHHVTVLLVERKIQYVDLAIRLIDGRRWPHDFASVLEYRFRHQGYFVISVGAGKLHALNIPLCKVAKHERNM